MAFREVQEQMKQDEVREALMRNQCPDCGNHGFINGPVGGAARNMFCANPKCRSAFNLTRWQGDAVMVERIGKAREGFYAPQVHVFHYGRTACACFYGQAPVDWPLGHRWVGRDEAELATCPECRKAVQRDGP